MHDYKITKLRSFSLVRLTVLSLRRSHLSFHSDLKHLNLLFHSLSFRISIGSFSRFAILAYLKMASPMNSGDVYVPSDDGMSDILHNAGHAYAMYLEENGHRDSNEMAIDQGQLVQAFEDLLIWKSSKVLSWLTTTSPIPSPPPSTASTSTTPFVSMTFNPATSVFSTTTGSKSLGGPLTPKSHESQGNIIRPVPLRSRFFPSEDATKQTRFSMFKPWFSDNKENLTIPFVDKEKNISDGKAIGERCLRCYDKAGFVLEPCTHTYPSQPIH